VLSALLLLCLKHIVPLAASAHMRLPLLED
jgi:hypothetical protein